MERINSKPIKQTIKVDSKNNRQPLHQNKLRIQEIIITRIRTIHNRPHPIIIIKNQLRIVIMGIMNQDSKIQLVSLLDQSNKKPLKLQRNNYCLPFKVELVSYVRSSKDVIII